MKKTRLLLLLLVVAMLGCVIPAKAQSEATDLLLAIQAEINEAPAIALSMDIITGIKMGEQEMEFTMTSEVTMIKDPVQMKLIMDLSSLGMDASEVYLVMEEEGYVQYQKNNGEWTKINMTEEEAAAFVNEQTGSADLLLTFGSDTVNAEMLPNEEINDIDCKVVKVIMSGESLVALLGSQSADSMELSDELLADISANMTETEVFYYINSQTGALVKTSIDMTAAYQSMITIMASENGDSSNADILGTMNISKMALDINIIAIGDVAPIEVPAEAIQ